jgi:flavin reductase (DIM6/NTAB) family NADH-FMN oxidoreductase RutF
MHKTIEPSILYFGTPVALISTLNEDGASNLSPISSIFWLGWRCILGFDAQSKTPQNLLRTRQCVVNLPSEKQVAAVNRLALTTATQPVPAHKQQRGYRHVADKFEVANLTPIASETVSPPRVQECPVQMEAILIGQHGIADDDAQMRGFLTCFELRVQRVHVDESLLIGDKPNRIDPDQWKPLIMSFQRFYGLSAELHESDLSSIPEDSYRSPDIDIARSLHRR